MKAVRGKKKSVHSLMLVWLVSVFVLLTACNARGTEKNESSQPDGLGGEAVMESSSSEENEIICTINGFDLAEFTIAASAEAMDAAHHLAGILEDKYQLAVPVQNVSEYSGGNVIFVGTCEINSYGGYRYFLGCEESDNTCNIYIDGQAEVLTEVIDCIVQKYMKKSMVTELVLPESAYEYCWLNREFSSGYALETVTERSLEDGVTYYEMVYGTYALGKVTVYAVVVEPGAEACAAVWAPPLGELEDVKSQAVELENAGREVLAISNAAFFNMNDGGPVAPYGIQIVDGVVIQEPSDEYPKYTHNWFGMTTDGEYVIADLNDYDNLYKGKLQCAVGGSYFLLRDGVVDVPESSSIAVRTAVAVTADGGFALLCANNASYADLAQVFMDLEIKVTDALNLDGGGSSVLLIEGEDGELEVAKVPRDGLRAVANSIAIVRKSSSGN